MASSTGQDELTASVRLHTSNRGRSPSQQETSSPTSPTSINGDYDGETSNAPNGSEMPNSPTPGKEEHAVPLTTYANANINEDALMFRVNWRIIPPLMGIYLLCYLDRVNIGNGQTSLKKTLHLSDTQYFAAVSALFLGYCLFEVPSNLMLRQLPAATWFSRIMVSWGLVSMLQAWVTNYAGLMVCRVFLGLTEAGLFPGLLYYISRWYTRRERAYIVSLIMCMQSVAGMIGGLIAYKALQLDGRHHLPGFAWIFIVEGAPTIAYGFLVYFIVTSDPDKAKWLTPEEKRFIKERVKAPVIDSLTFRDVMVAFSDPQILAWAGTIFCWLNGQYALSYFTVPVLNTFTTNTLVSNGLSVPIYAIALTVTLIVCRLADLKQNYWAFGVFSGSLAAIGFLLLGISLRISGGKGHFGFKYASLIIANTGLFSLIPNLFAWKTVGLVGSTKTAAGTAFVVSLASIGGVIGPSIMTASVNNTKNYSDGTFGIMAIMITGIAGILFIQLKWPYAEVVKDAEAQDLEGYASDGTKGSSKPDIELH